jgi:hypothetical protein
MISEYVFNLGNMLALLAWVMLIIFPSTRIVRVVVISGGLLLLLALCYLGMIIAHLPSAEGDFSSLEGVASMFKNANMVVAGWLHYLAFDLFVGIWITLDARAHKFKHWWIIPSLIFTFMLGPIGLLSYYILRSILMKNWKLGLFDKQIENDALQ